MFALLALLVLLLPTTTTPLTVPEQNLMKMLTSPSSKAQIESAISDVVSSPPNMTFLDPATNPKLRGLWELLYQTAPKTSSPVQRFLTTSLKADSFSESIPYNTDSSVKVFQEIKTKSIDIIVQPKSSKSNNLTVTALSGSTSAPPPNWSERENDGKLLGLNVLGVSKTNTPPPPSPYGDIRVIFLFDSGSFNINGLKIPYPVPFRSKLFRDNVKGWLDHVYLSEDLRICQGNKGTTFVLKRVQNN
ncbi:hypothetical protein TrLO_g571 [Triparma laevis f. longispina]|uniref:Plastid lipid-associated protein/fibrillin conserved domain-containing protein n=1 Tax=Triparma laevis f. longispina TaxID=1714387 RepID=A0A9W7A439_9STRA|nr:hypothetical protein TrLO_g571 [Triparma laevis f. longispina]